MSRLASLLRGPRAGAVALALLLVLSVGLPAAFALTGADVGPAPADGPSLGVLSSAALGGLHRLWFEVETVRPEALLPAALPVETRPAGEASPDEARVPSAAASAAASRRRLVEAPLRI